MDPPINITIERNLRHRQFNITIQSIDEQVAVDVTDVRFADLVSLDSIIQAEPLTGHPLPLLLIRKTDYITRVNELVANGEVGVLYLTIGKENDDETLVLIIREHVDYKINYI